MVTIGIKGKSGAGKTTVSNLIKEQDPENIAVIHLDDVWANFKKKYFKGYVTVQQDSNNNPVVGLNKNIKQRLMSNKIGRLLVDKKELFINLLVQTEYNRLKKQGKKAIIVEGDILDVYSISKKCNPIIEVKAPYCERKNRLKKRCCEKIDKREMVLRDLKYRNVRKKSRIRYVLINNGDKNELLPFAKEIYENEIEPKKTQMLNPWVVAKEDLVPYNPKVISVQKPKEAFEKTQE